MGTVSSLTLFRCGSGYCWPSSLLLLAGLCQAFTPPDLPDASLQGCTQLILLLVSTSIWDSEIVLTLYLALLNLNVFSWTYFSSPFHCINCTTLLGVCKLAESMLDHTDKGVEEHWSQYGCLEDTHRDWPPLGHRDIDHNFLAVFIQPFPYPLNYPSFKSISFQISDKDVCGTISKT